MKKNDKQGSRSTQETYLFNGSVRGFSPVIEYPPLYETVRITYTGFNKPSSIKTKDNKDTIKFKYNTNKQRFKKTSKDKTIYYLGKSYEYNAPQKLNH